MTSNGDEQQKTCGLNADYADSLNLDVIYKSASLQRPIGWIGWGRSIDSGWIWIWIFILGWMSIYKLS
jgi:hypothetical protein